MLAISGTYLGRTSSALVEVRSNNQSASVRKAVSNPEKKLRIQPVQRRLTAEDVEAALKSLTHQAT